MTTLTPLEIETAKQEDIGVIRDVLCERGDSLTLENARFVLCVGLLNRPEAWTIGLEELPELWIDLAAEVAGEMDN
jgi:hypothetical protein